MGLSLSLDPSPQTALWKFAHWTDFQLCGMPSLGSGLFIFLDSGVLGYNRLSPALCSGINPGKLGDKFGTLACCTQGKCSIHCIISPQRERFFQNHRGALVRRGSQMYLSIEALLKRSF